MVPLPSQPRVSQDVLHAAYFQAIFCSQSPAAYLGGTRPSFLKRFRRMLFHSLCSLQKLHKSTPPSHVIFCDSRGYAKARLSCMILRVRRTCKNHPVLRRPPQSPKITQEQGVLSRTVVVSCWQMLHVTQNIVAYHF